MAIEIHDASLEPSNNLTRYSIILVYKSFLRAIFLFKELKLSRNITLEPISVGELTWQRVTSSLLLVFRFSIQAEEGVAFASKKVP